MDGPPVVELVAAAVVRPLRHAVLRPGWPDAESAYERDDDPASAHVALRIADDDADDADDADAGSPTPGTTGIVAVGTVLPEAPPWEPARARAWRIRGMATRDDQRGAGLGTLVVRALLDHVGAQGGGLVWCNARVRASTLYERAGFVSRGAVDVPGIGPHLQMWRTVDALDGSPDDALDGSPDGLPDG
ncbi:MAG TPA: GNAT family N-acetyltransferase [Acidimicrobiales bacterium]|nr:GNAT family N-acetyltransferase [Acidimicrobiales bacterium]